MAMHNRYLRIILTIGISLVWFVNGLVCKVLHLVPRHELIVARILGSAYAPILTKIIGILEILMVVWILSGTRSRWCSVFQISIVMTMNIIEYILAPDLLLFGQFNIVVACIFAIILYIREFWIEREPPDHSRIS